MLIAYANKGTHPLMPEAVRFSKLSTTRTRKTPDGDLIIHLNNLEGNQLGFIQLSHDEARELALSCFRTLYNAE